MDILVTACGAAFVAAIFALVTTVLQHRWSNTDKNDAIKDALKVILLDRIKYLGLSYIDKGIVDADDRRLLKQMQDAYHELGGNGDLNEIMSAVYRLPLKKE